MAQARGRPTKYKPEYCEKLIEHMASGLSFECFAAEIGVCEDTLFEWDKVHPKFSESKRQGFIKSRAFWEKAIRDGTMGDIKGFNVVGAIFNLKNRFPKQWREKHEVEHSGKVGLESLVTGSVENKE